MKIATPVKLVIAWFLGFATGSPLIYWPWFADHTPPPECPKIVFPIEQYYDIPKHLGPYKYKRSGVMHAQLTAYDLGPGSINIDEYLQNGRTSIGRIPTPGKTIAVDPKVIPYGSKVFIPGIGWRVAEDTGGAIRGTRIDILVESEEKALQFGRRSEIVLWMRP